MEIFELIPHIEALIFASDKPLTTEEITELINNAFGFMEDKVSVEQIATALESIAEKYTAELYPFLVRQSGGGWQFLTKKEYHKTVAQLNGEKFLKRLSAAALETLAIIAYKQPITKGEIETIRGVSSDYTVQKLLEKELIVITGRNEQLPGHPLVYATSKSFMDYFGLNSTEDLPKIKEVLAEQVIEPTTINHTELEESINLSVSDEGELIDVNQNPSQEINVGDHSLEQGAKLFLDVDETADNGEESREDADSNDKNNSNSDDAFPGDKDKDASEKTTED